MFPKSEAGSEVEILEGRDKSCQPDQSTQRSPSGRRLNVPPLAYRALLAVIALL
jgi:hypothetical protein